MAVKAREAQAVRQVAAGRARQRGSAHVYAVVAQARMRVQVKARSECRP